LFVGPGAGEAEARPELRNLLRTASGTALKALLQVRLALCMC
jgi:hypothetical protein